MLEQMVETRKWTAIRGIGDPDGKCRLCGQHDDAVQHLLAGREQLAGAGYPGRHYNATTFMVLAANWSFLDLGLNPRDETAMLVYKRIEIDLTSFA